MLTFNSLKGLFIRNKKSLQRSIMELSARIIDTSVESITKIIGDVKLGSHFDYSELEMMAKNFLTELSVQGLKGPLNLPSCPDPQLYPIYHTIRVTAISVIVASRMGYKGDSLLLIAVGSLLHDIGKINTPDHLRWKQDGDDDYERETISEHPVFGANWIERLVMLPETARKIIEQHHERFDGKGYPYALTENAVTREAKLVAICNTYDFLIENHPEKPALEPRDAMLALIGMGGTRFAPKLVQNFIAAGAPVLLDGPLYQPSALVMLDTKEIAAVMKVDGWGDTTPEIVILTDSRQKKLLRPLAVNLKNDVSRKIIKVLKTG
jgi:putative nucleotidyltransferase with HDIG domain